MSFNKTIKVILNNDIYCKIQNGIEYLLNILENFILNVKLYSKNKEYNFIFKLPKSNCIYRIKDINDLIDNGPIEI